MESNWETKTLNDICEKITDGAHNSPKSVVNGKPMASVKDLTRFGVDLSEVRLIAIDEFEKLVKQGCRPEVGDVLIAKDGNSALDAVCIVKKPLDAVLLSSVAILRPNKKLVDSDFLKYYFSSSITIEYLKTNFISGAAIPRVVLKDFKRAEIKLPPLGVQKRISSILSSLDDKIELNQKMNKTLEAMAQALFKSWFVDFEPWGGVMPKEWRKGALSEIANITMGQSPDGMSFNTKKVGTVFYQGRAEFGLRFPTRRLFTTQPKRMAAEGDILMSVRAPVGDINVALEACCIGRGLVAIRNKQNAQAFMLYTMLSMKEVFETFNGEGTVFGSINKNDMASLPVFIPSLATVNQFEKHVSVMDSAIKANFKENNDLQNILDTLLPKLISGQLCIKDAKKFIGNIL